MATADQVAQHRRELVSLVTLGLSDLVALFRRMRGEEPAVIRRVLSEQMMETLDPYAAAVGDLSSDWYRELRVDSGVRGSFVAEPAALPSQGRIDALVNYATVVQVDAPAETATPTSNVTVAVDDAPDAAPATTGVSVTEAYVGDPESRLTNGAQRVLMNVARDTIADAAESDAAADWCRVPVGVTCAFCTLLASRGPVYKTRHAAGFVGMSERAYHDNCDCVPTPVFPGDDLPYDPDALFDLYQSSRDAANTGDMKKILAQMRQDHGLR